MLKDESGQVDVNYEDEGKNYDEGLSKTWYSMALRASNLLSFQLNSKCILMYAIHRIKTDLIWTKHNSRLGQLVFSTINLTSTILDSRLYFWFSFIVHHSFDFSAAYLYCLVLVLFRSWIFEGLQSNACNSCIVLPTSCFNWSSQLLE